MTARRTRPGTEVSVSAARSGGLLRAAPLDRRQVVGDGPERGRVGRLDHGRGVPLERRVHWRAPASAAAPPVVSARSAATASSIRSRCAS